MDALFPLLPIVRIRFTRIENAVLDGGYGIIGTRRGGFEYGSREFDIDGSDRVGASVGWETGYGREAGEVGSHLS